MINELMCIMNKFVEMKRKFLEMSSNKLDSLAKLLADPKVNEIIDAANKESGITVKQLAKFLKEKPSNLYYPIQRMTDFGLLKVVSENQIKNLTEKVYSSAFLYKNSRDGKKNDQEIDLGDEYVKEHGEDLMELLMINQKRVLQAFKKNVDFIQGGGNSDKSTFSWAQSDLKLSNKGRIELLRKLNEETANFKDPYPDDPQVSLNMEITMYSDVDPQANEETEKSDVEVSKGKSKL